MPQPDASATDSLSVSPSTTAERPTAAPARSESATGIIFGIGAYGLWGLLPLYFLVLKPAGAVEIVANRVVWSLIFCALLITVTRAWSPLLSVLRDRRIFATLAVAAALIAVNWLTYTWGVTNGHAIETSLGYFINPLVSVLLGVLVLKERLRPLQWAAVGIGFVAVIVLTVAYGQLPWIALTLAFSFGLYGFVKKRVGPRVDAASSLTVETIVLTPAAVVVMGVLMAQGQATVTTAGAGHFWLMAASGVVTAVPLLFFGASARRLPMTTIGLLQYVAPLLQFTIATVILHEQMGPERWVGFGIVWLALIVLTADMLLVSRDSARLRRAAAR
ncbi:EamA family transporter RarD [Paenarthrobacter sp. DKR-5]|uniref:EamA family transporter RarD n=1 Tax=Paenarthrobacter sp. DKR-5 TaxID=2835535 RepID=UPI001BDBC738|nr:EamA family transporter RarD [Paenarthrobacter sp. DKR-5]